jgi:beta-phosphoglucomutase
MLKAVVFDFDGVIVDTEPLHYKAFQEVLAPLGLGYGWQEYLDHYIGFDDRDAFREVHRLNARPLADAALARLIMEKAASFQVIIAQGVEPYPGVVELVREIAASLPLAICSGALAADIIPILTSLDLTDSFDLMVTADDVSVSKPDPQSYSLAVSRLAHLFPEKGISPASCLAIEDTPAGIASATGAGLSVLAVSNSYPAERLGQAWKVVSSLQGISLATLQGSF